ncbi:hypothetical protein ACFWOJ_32380 [Streptomyces sp. NPDC058439]|uniref:hypothetical protein n=1 Tax=Streptomyces sp. NPDC058439 TaxID=3346500 RepID=UPI00364E8A9C
MASPQSPEQKPPLPRKTPRGSTTARSTTADLPQPGQHSAMAKVQEAVEARDTLAAALSAAGIQLPAMDIRTPWPEPNSAAGDGDDGRQQRYALVHLGICSAPVALALAAVIRSGAAR